MTRSDLFKAAKYRVYSKILLCKIDKYLPNLIWIIFSSAEYENYLFYRSENFIYRLAHVIKEKKINCLRIMFMECSRGSHCTHRSNKTHYYLYNYDT